MHKNTKSLANGNSPSPFPKSETTQYQPTQPIKTERAAAWMAASCLRDVQRALPWIDGAMSGAIRKLLADHYAATLTPQSILCNRCGGQDVQDGLCMDCGSEDDLEFADITRRDRMEISTDEGVFAA